MNISQLRKILDEFPDQTEVSMFYNDTQYDLNLAYVENLECIEHNGKVHYKSGIFIDVNDCVTPGGCEVYQELTDD